MNTYDAREVANFILDTADKLLMPISHLSLQKILYFAHGWHYAYYNKPLIKNGFEAWQYGPVIRTVYESFRSCGDAPIIQLRAYSYDPIKNQKNLCNYNFLARQRHFLEGIFQEYGPLSAHNLVNMSHLPGSPWHLIWKRPKDQDAVGLYIPEHLIEDYFKSMLREKRLIN